MKDIVEWDTELGRNGGDGEYGMDLISVEGLKGTWDDYIKTGV